jgi:1-acyl-sn-glycerol-3-phosphate acyltransferase
MKKLRASVRFFLFVVLTLAFYGIWYLGSFLVPNKTFWRQFAFQSWAKMFVRVANAKVEVFGTPPKPPFFLVCNHLSYTDIPVLRYVVQGVFVAKSEIEDWFLAGRIVRDMGTIFINRRKKRDIPRAAREIIQKLEHGEGVIIFPEGTSTKGEEVLPFNSSFLEFAARQKLPVHYASLSYQTPSDEPNASETICWWDDTVFIHHMWRLFSLSEFTAIVNFGDVPISNPDRKELAHRLREKVREKFIPVL